LISIVCGETDDRLSTEKAPRQPRRQVVLTEMDSGVEQFRHVRPIIDDPGRTEAAAEMADALRLVEKKPREMP
jgi:hypothetical protein